MSTPPAERQTYEVTCTHEELERLIRDEPMSQLPGENDENFSRFLTFIDSGMTKLSAFYRDNKKELGIKVYQTMWKIANVYRWQARQCQYLQLVIDQKRQEGAIAARQAYIDQHTLASKWTERLIQEGIASHEQVKAGAMFKAAAQMIKDVMQDAQKHGQIEAQVAIQRIKSEQAELDRAAAREKTKGDGDDLD